MHKYMRTIGFSQYSSDQAMNRLLRHLAREAAPSISLEGTGASRLCELRFEAAPGIGVTLVGKISSKGIFTREYYFPYVENTEITSQAECSLQRHTERETFAGLLDEYRVGISLIFYMKNSLEYRLRRQQSASVKIKAASLSGLASRGTILLPVQKTPKQQEALKQASRKRTSLLEAAKRGDEDAIETLTVEDIDLYSMVTRRITQEDVYSILETCFMPCGVECDQYSIVGLITAVTSELNRLTGEEIYLLKLDCNDMNFTLAVN